MRSNDDFKIEYVVKSITGIADYIKNWMSDDKQLAALAEFWRSREFTDKLKSFKTYDDLIKSDIFITMQANVARLEPVLAFEALTGSGQALNLYYAVQLWDGFKPAPHNNGEDIRQKALDYIGRNTQSHDEVVKSLMQQRIDTENGPIYGINIMINNTFYQQRYGHSVEDLKAALDVYDKTFNMQVITRILWFRDKRSLKEVRQQYPDHTIINAHIPFDMKCLKGELRHAFFKHQTEQQKAEYLRALEKKKGKAPLKRRGPKK